MQEENTHNCIRVFVGFYVNILCRMDSSNLVKNKATIAWFVVFLLVAISECAQGSIECEDLHVEDCAFAVSSSGARCVLEKYVRKDGASEFECQTSLIMAEKKIEWIESLECVNFCGLSRMTVGLSTDKLLEKDFTTRLCAPKCQNYCPNIFDLYIKLAAGDGLYLPHLCRLQRLKSRRLIFNPVQDIEPKDTASLEENALSSSWTYNKEGPGDEQAHDSAVPAAPEPSGSMQSGNEKEWTSSAPGHAPQSNRMEAISPTPVKSKEINKHLPSPYYST